MSHENAQNANSHVSDEPQSILGAIEGDETKECYECGTEKPITEFQRGKRGYVSICNDCRKPPQRRELLFPDPNRHPFNLDTDVVRKIRADYERGMGMAYLISEHSTNKRTLTWRVVRDIVIRRTYDDVE